MMVEADSLLSPERRKSLIAELSAVILHAVVNDSNLLASAIVEGRVGLEEMSDLALVRLAPEWGIDVDW